jgi:hypothetical protein
LNSLFYFRPAPKSKKYFSVRAKDKQDGNEYSVLFFIHIFML